MTQQTCQSCRWWQGGISGRIYNPGKCRRFPPPNPVTHINDFCGEYTRKDDANAMP